MVQEDWEGAYLLLRVSAHLSRRSALLARLGRVAVEVGKFRIAVEHLEKAVTLSGASRYSEVQLAATLLHKGYSRSARERIDAVLTGDPECARAHLVSGAIHRSESNDDLAIKSLERAIGSAQSRATAALACWRLANVYKDRGRRDEVIDLCLRAIAIDGDFAPAYYELAHIGYYRDPAHPHLAKMEELLRDRRLMRDKRAGLCFALAMAYDRQGRFDEAFLHFQRGNRGRQARFNPRRARNDATRRIEAFTRERIKRLSAYGATSDAIIFIVGMPRSGTTLAEQILDSHPNVAGLGERVELLQTTHRLQTRLAWSKLPYPECVRFLNADIVRAVADEMLEELTGSAPDARYVVTKRPNDFWELGLIKILFPNCKIIHCCRHPADTCLSCFMQDFSDVPFASRLEHLASYYAQYERMMAHWAMVLDATQMFTLRYESLVRNFRPVTEALLDFCGLAYDDDCEVFFKNNRSVETASVWQVREPIYARSVERWLNYARFLGPLRRFINDPAASSWLDHDGAPRRASEPSAGRTFSVEGCETIDADLGGVERFSANSEPPRLKEAEHVEFAG